MLIVAPRGSVKLVILFDTPARLRMQSMVRGRVAEEEAVENAVRRAGAIA